MPSAPLSARAGPTPPVQARFNLAADRLADLCARWGIVELCVFGSALRDDFRPDSDVDVLVTFDDGGGYTFETLPDLLDELSRMFAGRRIDLVEKPLITNPFRRHAILSSRQVLYAA
jgi:predicted nucleotidyltransferase